jgi:hypothetical protein
MEKVKKVIKDSQQDAGEINLNLSRVFRDQNTKKTKRREVPSRLATTEILNDTSIECLTIKVIEG